MRRVLHNLDNPNDNHVQCINCALAGNRIRATFEYIIPSFGIRWSCIQKEQNIHMVLFSGYKNVMTCKECSIQYCNDINCVAGNQLCAEFYTI